jgi:hypothetical protein
MRLTFALALAAFPAQMCQVATRGECREIELRNINTHCKVYDINYEFADFFSHIIKFVTSAIR